MENSSEIWKDIQGYEGSYQVSNFGNIKSLPRFLINRIRPYFSDEIIMSQRLNSSQYKCINLRSRCKMKTFNVHRLVAKAFVENPENKKIVNHKDGVRINNRADNLEWVTTSENELHAYNVLGKIGSNTGNTGAKSASGKVTIQYLNDQVVNEFGSRLEAVRLTGFQLSGINNALKNGVAYKGYLWKTG